MRCAKNHIGNVETNRYATTEDFHTIVAEKMDSLYLLALLLTGDHEMAEQSFLSGIEESVQANQVFKQWAHDWAKCNIIQSAIHALKPQSSGANSLPSASPMPLAQNKLPTGTDSKLYPVLALEDFERFVFVMSVLEKYSDRECAVLLGCSEADIREARARAFQQIALPVHTNGEIYSAIRYLETERNAETNDEDTSSGETKGFTVAIYILIIILLSEYLMLIWFSSRPS
ncbi:MAG TPA: hypothetical protein VK699_14770 [Terriglobales bacterium]|jgi:hypothetical protein|nr:hypothetical protein [Terriglobales bacterium]